MFPRAEGWLNLRTSVRDLVASSGVVADCSIDVSSELVIRVVLDFKANLT